MIHDVRECRSLKQEIQMIRGIFLRNNVRTTYIKNAFIRIHSVRPATYMLK